MKYFFPVLACILCVLGGPRLSAANTKAFIRTVDQPFSGSQSPDDAYMSAMTKAKFEVLELAGTYLETLSVVENAILTRDEVTALAGGIMKTKIISAENYADDKGFGIILTTRIEVDNSVLKKRLERLLNDRTLLRKYNELQSREQELLNRIKALEKQNSTAGSPVDTATPLQQIFARISVALTAGQWIEKALALWQNGQFSDPDKAIEFLSKAIALDNNNPATFNSRAVALLSTGKYKLAKKDLEKALSIKPDYCDACNNLGSLFYQTGNYEDAIDAYTRAIEQQPGFTQAILNRGMAYRKIFQFENAFEDFHQVMVLQPAAPSPTQEAGALARLNDLDRLCSKAETACKKGLCNALDFLHARNFCLNQNKSAAQ